jgi:hypothetical protein
MPEQCRDELPKLKQRLLNYPQLISKDSHDINGLLLVGIYGLLENYLKICFAIRTNQIPSDTLKRLLTNWIEKEKLLSKNANLKPYFYFLFTETLGKEIYDEIREFEKQCKSFRNMFAHGEFEEVDSQKVESCHKLALEVFTLLDQALDTTLNLHPPLAQRLRVGEALN